MNRRGIAGSRESTRQVGDRGEAVAARYLKRVEGYRLVARNVRNAGGELDLVAWDRETLCFVEIKLRQQVDFGSAAQAVDRRKQERVRRAAECFLQAWHGPFPECRFDVVAVEPSSARDSWGERIWERLGASGAWRVTLYRDAF